MSRARGSGMAPDPGCIEVASRPRDAVTLPPLTLAVTQTTMRIRNESRQDGFEPKVANKPRTSGRRESAARALPGAQADPRGTPPESKRAAGVFLTGSWGTLPPAVGDDPHRFDPRSSLSLRRYRMYMPVRPIVHHRGRVAPSSVVRRTRIPTSVVSGVISSG